MASTVFSPLAYLGAAFVAQVAEQQLAELELAPSVRSRCIQAFTDPALERDAARQRLYLLAAIGDRLVEWPRLAYWKSLFDQAGGARPYMWTQGIYPVERRRSRLRKAEAAVILALKTEAPAQDFEKKPVRERRQSADISLEERHHLGLIGLLQHYVQYICYAERDRRHISNLGVEPLLTLSRDAVENRIERLWLEKRVDRPDMWRAEPPFFPGHRATLRPRLENSRGSSAASRSSYRNVWVVSA